MSVRHDAVGNQVLIVYRDGEERVRATCADHATAKKAAALLDRARFLNDEKRRYTDAARAIATAQSLPGFKWIGEGAAK